MQQVKSVLCLLLVCVLLGSLLPVAAAAEDIKITAMEFTVQNLAVGEKGTAVRASLAADAPITFDGLASLRYDDAGAAGMLVKSDLLASGQIYWLCVNPVVKDGYSLTPFILQSLDCWTINGLPKGVSFDKVVVSGNQVRFRLTPMLEEIDSVEFTGLCAPQFGQTVQEYYDTINEEFFNGNFKINGYSITADSIFSNIKWDGGWLCDDTKNQITNVSEEITGGIYYLRNALVPAEGFVFTDDVTVTVAGATDVEAKLDGEDLVVYAEYEVSAPISTYTVTFDSDGGSAVAAQTVESGKTTTKPADPTKEGYTFKGWYLGESAYDFATPVAGDITLKAKWEINCYTIIFDSDGGSAVTAQTAEHGKTATKPADPTKEGYTFKGWYLGESAYDFSTPVAGNITLKAKWENNCYTITFDPNGGSVTPTSMLTDADGWLKNLPTPTHSDPNMLFDGWHTSQNSDSQVADACMFSKDTTLYAHWKAKPAHTVAEVYIDSIQTPAPGVMPSNHVTITTTGVHGITDSGDTFWVRYDAATDSLADTYEDSTFVDSVPFREEETYLLMLVMEAQTDYGFAPDVKVFYKGVELPVPSMSDVTASCLLDHDDEYIVVLINPGEFATTTYTVTFNSDGGSAVAAQTVETGKAAAKPADPAKEGYTFLGWYLESTKYDFSKPVTDNIILTAKWEEKAPAHTHTYSDGLDGTCNGCGAHREEVEERVVVHMFRMYNPNTGEHFYTGSEEERDNLISVGWQYEGVGFTFPANTGLPVHRLFQPSTGEHLYTMSEEEKDKLMAEDWNYEGIAFNSAYDTEAVQHRLHNPNAIVGAYHFTFSEEEKQNLIEVGWEYQGIGWYSCWK